MNVANRQAIEQQVNTLCVSNCYDSAEIVISLYLSSLSKSSMSKSDPEFLQLLGDVIFKKGEYKRALACYKGAAGRKKNNKIENEFDSQLRYKECLCHIELTDHTTAMRELDAIPTKLRDLKINMCLGKLAKSANIKRLAISSFTLAIRETPLAVEAIEALVNLGVDAVELASLINDSCLGVGIESICSLNWLQSLLSSLVHKRNFEYEKCDLKLQDLLVIYPKHTYILSLLGRNALNAEKVDEAMGFFKRIRRIDPLILDHMDQYGLLLIKTAEENELNKLSHDLLNVSIERPIGWLIVAMFCEYKGDTEKAMQFVDKAISQDSKYAPGYRLKGQFLLAHNHPEQAAIAYFQAKSLEKDISSFSGLIQAYLSVGKFKDAIATAKEAITCMPKSSTAYCMMGKVLAQVPEGTNEAIRAFTKSLKLSPDNTTAASYLSDALTSQNKIEDSVLSLRQVLNMKPSAELRIQLAKNLSLLGKHGDAITELHLVMSMNCVDPVDVNKELERIESLMRLVSSGTNIDKNETNGDDDNNNNSNKDDDVISIVEDIDSNISNMNENIDYEEYEENVEREENDTNNGNDNDNEDYNDDNDDDNTVNIDIDANEDDTNINEFDYEDCNDDSNDNSHDNDREAGILLDSPMEESEALGDPSPNNSYSRVDNISTSNDSISVYRTRGHIRSLNMQTPT